MERALFTQTIRLLESYERTLDRAIEQRAVQIRRLDDDDGKASDVTATHELDKIVSDPGDSMSDIHSVRGLRIQLRETVVSLQDALLRDPGVQ